MSLFLDDQALSMSSHCNEYEYEYAQFFCFERRKYRLVQCRVDREHGSQAEASSEQKMKETVQLSAYSPRERTTKNT